jgi:deoxyadenosine/deoxycytidine kinase
MSCAKTKRPLVVCVEGNIGAGKSTLLTELLLAGDGFARVVPEPIERWSDPWRPGSPKSPLREFYEAPERNAFGFQVYVVASYARALRRALDEATESTEVLFLERDPFSMAVFARLGLLRGDISAFDHFCLSECVDNLRAACLGVPSVPNPVVYLRTDCDTCVRRIAARGRICEGELVSERVADVGRLYDEEYMPGGAARDARTLVLDGSLPTSELARDALDFARSMLSRADK